MKAPVCHCGFCGRLLSALSPDALRGRLLRHMRNCTNAARKWLKENPQEAGHTAQAASKEGADLGLEGVSP